MSITFGSRLKNIRTDKNIKREDLASMIGTSSAIIGRYERNERTPSIDIAKNLAQALNVSIDFLAGDTSVLVKDKEVLKRIEDIEDLPDEDKNHLFYVIDNLIKAVKLKSIA